MHYRWAVLGAGTLSQASFSAITVGLAVLAPVLREEYSLSLGQIGALLAAAWVGSVVTLLPWGICADRFGERVVLALGLAGAAAFLAGAAATESFEALFGLLVLAGGAGASVNSASGRAVMLWFGPGQRGLALGIRQTAVPLGGLVAALALPGLVEADGSAAGFLFLSGFCLLGAFVGAFVIRGRERIEAPPDDSFGRTLRDVRLWRLSLASGLYVYAQIAIIGFGVLFLHDAHHLGAGEAALVIAVSQLLAVGMRIGAGRWSDVVGSRIRPLRLVGLAVSAALLVTGALAGARVELVVPAVAIAGALSMAWNGLAFTAAAELAGAARSGAAIGFQQTVLAALGVVAPIVFARTVSSGSWTVAFVLAAALPVVGWLGLRPLSDV